MNTTRRALQRQSRIAILTGAVDGLNIQRMDIELIKNAVASDCEAFAVKRLDVFGSVARGEDSLGSDLDLLVEFKEPSDHPAKRFFGLLHRLEDRFHCRIDLLTPSGLRNPYVQRRIFAERVPIYEG